MDAWAASLYHEVHFLSRQAAAVLNNASSFESLLPKKVVVAEAECVDGSANK